MAVATIGAAAASPCLRHVHLLGLLIEAHPVEKFLWAKFKMQGDIMILLSDITLQVKVKLPYTDMMEGLHSSQKCYHLASKHNCHLFGGTLLMWLFRVIRCFNTKSDMYAIFYAGDANGVMEGEIRPQSQSSLCLKAYRLFPSCLHPGKTMFNLISVDGWFVTKDCCLEMLR
uniref:Uncharacterized protein n=1 Tax=Oryza rufipogon TaxID=4529 RepID=A0A0E0NCG2_ORYRU